MTTPLHDRLVGDERASLRTDVTALVDTWAANLLAIDPSELDHLPERDAVCKRLTATALVIAELDEYSRLLERQAWQAGVTQPAIAEARGVSPQAVSARLRGGERQSDSVIVNR